MFFLRKILWRILGVDYQHILKKLDYMLLIHDVYSTIGKGTYNNGAKVWRWTKAKLIIGHYCSIAHDVNFIVDEGYHKGSVITSYPFYNNKSESNLVSIQQKEGIIIGNDVWIGMGAFIMPGVKVGNGVTIAANSVVTKDIPDYVVVAGSPAKVIKQKFTDEQIVKLNQIAWWNWPSETIHNMKIDFYRLSVSEFIEKYYEN